MKRFFFQFSFHELIALKSVDSNENFKNPMIACNNNENIHCSVSARIFFTAFSIIIKCYRQAVSGMRVAHFFFFFPGKRNKMNVFFRYKSVWINLNDQMTLIASTNFHKQKWIAFILIVLIIMNAKWRNCAFRVFLIVFFFDSISIVIRIINVS